MDPEDGQLDARQLIGILARRRWVVVSSLVAVVCVVGVGTFMQAPIYQATALLLVETSSPQLPGVQELPLLASALDIPRARSVETHRRLIKSRLVLEATINDLGLDMSFDELERKVDVVAFRDTDLLEIKVRNPEASHAADIADAIALHYAEESQTYSREAARSARDFLEEQIANAREELQNAENALLAFKHQQSIVHLSAEMEAAIERIGEMEAQRAAAQAQAQAAEAEAASTRTELARHEEVQEFSRTIQKNPVLGELELTLLELEIERAGVLEDYTEGSPEVAVVDARIGRTRQELSNHVATIIASSQEQISPVYQSLLIAGVQQEAEAEGARQRAESIARTTSRLSASLNGLPAKEAKLADLTRAQKVADTVYVTLRQKWHEVRLSEAMQLSGARIWEPAIAPEKPILPRKTLNMALAFAFGLLLGLLLAAVVEHVDDTIHSRSEAKEALGIPVMGVVPLVRDETQRLLTSVSRNSALVEAYRMIRSNIGFAALDSPVKTLLITSSGEGEGKSTAVANLGIVMAQQGNSVIVVDADLRRPTLHHLLGTENKRGLTNVLVGEATLADVVLETGIENLRFISSGRRPPDTAELLASQRAHEILNQLRDLADLVIFDSPPAVVVADAGILAATVDGTLLVVEHKATRRSVALDSKERLEAARAALLGTILNKAVAGPGEYEYRYGYDRDDGDEETTAEPSDTC